MRRKQPTKTSTDQKTVPPSHKPNNHLVVVFPDLHIPYHDEAALGVALHTIETLKPEKVVILGDWLDAEDFSQHPPTKLAADRGNSFYQEEILPCQEVLDKISQHTQEIVFISGNHEYRVERVACNDRFVEAVYDLISPETLLSCHADGTKRKNFTWVPYSQYITAAHYKITPDLWAFHGITHSKHASDTTLEKLRTVSGVYGHIHREQRVTKRNPIDGRLIRVWSPGCLSSLVPFWKHAGDPPVEWCHGFSLVYVRDDLSEWTPYTVTIQNGEAVLPDGRTIRA